MRALVQRATLNHVSETTASDTKEIRTIFSLYSPVTNLSFFCKQCDRKLFLIFMTLDSVHIGQICFLTWKSLERNNVRLGSLFRKVSNIKKNNKKSNVTTEQRGSSLWRTLVNYWQICLGGGKPNLSIVTPAALLHSCKIYWLDTWL